MTAEATSPLHIEQAPGAWARYLAFLRRPVLPDRASGFGADGLLTVAKLLALDVLVMAALVVMLALAAKLGFTAPKSLLDGIKPTGWLMVFMAMGAPLGEELVFRSWQSGRVGHIGALITFLIGSALGTGLILHGGTGFVVGGLAASLAGLSGAGWWLWSKRAKPAMGWFQRHYAWFYYGAAFVFAAAHITNFAGGVSLALLPLTLPQFSIGLMLGYVRVRYGLWSSVLLHASHNTLFLLLMLAGVR